MDGTGLVWPGFAKQRNLLPKPTVTYLTGICSVLFVFFVLNVYAHLDQICMLDQNYKFLRSYKLPLYHVTSVEKRGPFFCLMDPKKKRTWQLDKSLEKCGPTITKKRKRNLDMLKRSR